MLFFCVLFFRVSPDCYFVFAIKGREFIKSARAKTAEPENSEMFIFNKAFVGTY